MTKKITIYLLVSLLVLGSFSSYSFAKEPFDIDAKAALLMDFGSGQILYEKNANKKLEPASITKIMVLLIAMESLDEGRINLEDKVNISNYAASMGGSQVYLEAGGVNTVEELLRAICLRSANDASVALGEYIAGSEELFLQMMNNKSKELGMNNTNFMNLTGLPEDKHYTSAYDISSMSRELLKHKKIHQWLTIWMSTIMVGKNHDVEQELVNTNKLIRFYKGANGIKTGSTSTAGFCLSASASRGNTTFISVILGAENSQIRFSESKKLLDYGFANYESRKIYNKGDVVKKIPVEKGKIKRTNIIVKDDISILLKKGDNNDIQKKINIPDVIKAPINKGDIVGEVIISLSGKVVNKESLIVQEEIKKANMIDMFKRILSKMVVK